MSPARYARQVENLRDALAEADPAHAAAYRANAERYLAQFREMDCLLDTSIPHKEKTPVTPPDGEFSGRFPL